MLDLHGNPLSEDELEQQKDKLKEGPVVVHDCEHPFAEDLIAAAGAGVVDPQLSVLTKVFCLVDALKMAGSYELFEKLWAQIMLTAGRVNTEVVSLVTKLS